MEDIGNFDESRIDSVLKLFSDSRIIACLGAKTNHQSKRTPELIDFPLG